MRLLLVHGAFQRQEVWNTLRGILLLQGYDAQAIELPGRNCSPMRVTLDDYVRTIESEIRQKSESTCLVLHSFAGIHGAIAASRCLDLVKAIVFLAANIASQGESPFALLNDSQRLQKELCDAMLEDRWLERQPQVVVEYFVNECNRETQERFCSTLLCREPALPYFGIVNYATDWVSYLHGRMIYLRGKQDKPTNPERAIRYAAKIGVQVEEID